MKTILKKLTGAGLIIILLAIFSFTSHKGGDSFRVFFNDRLMLEQFVHMDKAVKNLQLGTVSDNDRLDVYYSHCGVVGKQRYLTVNDEDNRPIHVLEFADARNGSAAMSFTVKQLMPHLKAREKFSLVYSSKELPKGMTIANFEIGN